MSQAHDSPEVDGLVQGESSENATTSTSTRSDGHEEENTVPKKVPRFPKTIALPPHLLLPSSTDI